MCKILIEKCLKIVDNKFELVLVAIKNAKKISSGKIKLSEEELKNKVTYLALKSLEKKNTENNNPDLHQ